MFGDSIESPRELFTHKLGAALTMEQKVLGMLPQLEEASTRSELKERFRHHATETEQQIRNLEQIFHTIGAEVDDKPCPAIEGLEKEGQTMLKQTDERLVDVVVLGAAAETEHHEIAVYEGLIAQAEALGEQDVVPLLQENLEIEQHTLDEVKRSMQQVAPKVLGAAI
jgi:ferritin-like metal-binding protein YciE